MFYLVFLVWISSRKFLSSYLISSWNKQLTKKEKRENSIGFIADRPLTFGFYPNYYPPLIILKNYSISCP